MTMQKFELLLEMTMSQISSLTNSSRDVDLFSNLPSELIIDILSRLPFPTIMNCKCVCKSWLNLFETHEFAKSHKAKSVPVLAVCEYQGKTYSYHLYEVKEVFNLAVQDGRVAKLNLPFNGWIIGSADGLLFMCDVDFKPHSLYVCNPFTRDYTVFHYCQELDYSDSQVVTYGFGVSKLKAQHKVVRIFHDCIHDQETEEIIEVTNSECQVYTLETGTWRSIAPGAPFDYIEKTNHGLFLEGNLHWLVYDLNSCLWISCFDLETEHFRTFAPPPFERRETYYVDIDVSCGRLFICYYNSSYYNGLVIWSMDTYGVEKSWTKKFSKNKTREVIERFEQADESHYEYGVIHTPSFFSLTSFGFPNVISF